MQRRIILAAGHGGSDPGVVARGRTEAAECVDIVNRTAAKLRADGRVEVVVVPHALGLRGAIDWINARYANRDDGYCIEVHKNAARRNATGVEAWYLAGSDEGKRKAKVLVEALSRVTRLPNRGVIEDTRNRHGRLGWVRQTRPWAGLFECGFIDRDHFRNDLYAEGLFRGIVALVGLQDTATTIYRVIRRNGVQVGAYRVRSNAWAAYLGLDGDAVIMTREGRDVTSEFIDEFAKRIQLVPETDGFEGYEPFVHGDVEQVDEVDQLLPEADTTEVVEELPIG